MMEVEPSENAIIYVQEQVDSLAVVYDSTPFHTSYANSTYEDLATSILSAGTYRQHESIANITGLHLLEQIDRSQIRLGLILTAFT